MGDMQYFKGTPSSYTSPQLQNSALRVAAYASLFGLPDAWTNPSYYNVEVSIYENNNLIETITSASQSTTITFIKDGFYSIVYKGGYTYTPGENPINRPNNTLTYTFAVVENQYPMKKWTIKDVINRLLDVAEPIRRGETPRFKLNAGQSVLFDNILAPQFSFTKQTLRECLQAVGGVVHGEPRLTVKNDGGGWYYELSYDMYGGTEVNKIAVRPYCNCTVSQAIEHCCTYVDTSAENLVNALGESLSTFISGRNGVITEPYAGGFKTVRCDTMYARISEDNMLIATQLPIYSVQKLEVGLIPNNTSANNSTDTQQWTMTATAANAMGTYEYPEQVNILNASATVISSTPSQPDVTAEVIALENNMVYIRLDNTQAGTFTLSVSVTFARAIDLTAYVFEASEYNTRLSSYDSAYPYSKAYGLMYTQGQKNITALNFKPDTPVSPVFKNYSIINILEEVTGTELFDLSTKYPELAFRITYTPFYSARVAQSKPYYKEALRGSALVYNQGANVIESRFYGENLKGVIARLGNVEMTRTYRLSRLNLIPQAGQKYNDDYYISAVNVELFTNLINVTIALSKDFNRLSQYIGISSVKRYSEVSQTQAVERNVLYREYIAIGDSEQSDSDSLIEDSFMRAVQNTFTSASEFNPVTNVVTWGVSAQDNELPLIQLPVIGSAFGNSISFGWAYEDNYSAEAIAQYAEGNGVSGYFQNNLRYTDYYGRMYYYNFDLRTGGTIPQNYEQQTRIGLALPEYDGYLPTGPIGHLSTVGKQPLKLRKDNREILKVNVQIDFVTNRKGFIIGSALASNNPLIGGNSLPAKLYVFTDTLDKFINHVAGSMDVDFNTETVDGYSVQTLDLPNSAITATEVNNGRFSLNIAGRVFPGAAGAKYKAWAIVTPQISNAEQVEDEEGNTTIQTVQYGGDVLIAQNMDFSAGDEFPPIYFTKKREVFDKSVWTTAR